MSKCVFVGVDAKARMIKGLYIGVNGKARKVKKAYIGVNGKARLFFNSGYSESIPGVYVFVGYDNKTLLKFDPNTLGIASSTRVFSDVTDNFNGGISAGGCSGLLVLSKYTMGASNVPTARDARVVNSKTGATISKINSYELVSETSKELYSGGTANILISSSQWTAGTGGVSYYQDIRKRDPVSYAITSSGRTPIASEYGAFSNMYTKGGTEVEIYFPYITSYTDDGDRYVDDHACVLNTDTLAIKREAIMGWNSTNRTRYCSMDFFDNRIYFMECLRGTGDGMFYILDVGTLGKIKTAHTPVSEMYWESVLATVK